MVRGVPFPKQRRNATMDKKCGHVASVGRLVQEEQVSSGSVETIANTRLGVWHEWCTGWLISECQIAVHHWFSARPVNFIEILDFAHKPVGWSYTLCEPTLDWVKHVGCASCGFTFLMYAAMSFSMLYFSRACVAHSTASCCMSSDMSAFLITAFLSDMVALGNQNTAEDSSSSQAHWQTHNAIDSRPKASQQFSSSIDSNGTL